MAIISAVVLVCLGILTYFTLDLFEEDMTNMVTLVNSRSTKLLAEKVETEIKLRAQNLEIVDRLRAGGNYALIKSTYMNPESDNLHLMAITGAGTAYEMSNSTAILGRGMKQAEVNTALAKLKNTALFKSALKGEMIVKNISVLFKRPIWMLSVPVIPGQKAVIGIYSSEALARVFVPAKAQKAGGANSLVTSYMVDTAGQIILHPNKDWVLKSKKMDASPIVQAMQASPTNHSQREYTEDGKANIGAFQRIDTGNLGIITSVDKTAALQGVSDAQIRALFISLLIIASAIIFIYFFAKTMTSPIKLLVRAAKNIRQGDYGQHLDAMTSDEIGELTEAFNHMSEGLEEREKLKGAFNKFVNEEIANQVLAGNLKLGGEAKQVTVFFSDIRSFTAISEKLNPAEVVEFLNQYMTLMVSIIHEKKGVVDKFIGDAIMAIWGAPVTRKNDALNCVEAALLMREALLQFNSKRGTAKKPYINVGCGINTGEVLAGQIGSEDRLEYTVIGDAVNLASRVESLSKTFGADILISSSTYAQVKGKFKCIPMEKIAVKGKSAKQQVYAVLGRANDNKAPRNLAELRKLLNIKVTRKGRKQIMQYALLKR